MKCSLVSFGQIEIDGRRFDHDVVIEKGRIRRRKKGPSKKQRVAYGHTPLTPDEAVPWSAPLLIVGTGAGGQLPITDDLYRAAAKRRRGGLCPATPRSRQLLPLAALKSVAANLPPTR